MITELTMPVGTVELLSIAADGVTVRGPSGVVKKLDIGDSLNISVTVSVISPADTTCGCARCMALAQHHEEVLDTLAAMGFEQTAEGVVH